MSEDIHTVIVRLRSATLPRLADVMTAAMNSKNTSFPSLRA